MTYEEAKLDAFAALVPPVGERYSASFAGTEVEVTVHGFRPGGYVVCGIMPKGEPEVDDFIGKLTLI